MRQKHQFSHSKCFTWSLVSGPFQSCQCRDRSQTSLLIPLGRKVNNENENYIKSKAASQIEGKEHKQQSKFESLILSFELAKAADRIGEKPIEVDR